VLAICAVSAEEVKEVKDVTKEAKYFPAYYPHASSGYHYSPSFAYGFAAPYSGGQTPYAAFAAPYSGSQTPYSAFATPYATPYASAYGSPYASPYATPYGYHYAPYPYSYKPFGKLRFDPLHLHSAQSLILEFLLADFQSGASVVPASTVKIDAKEGSYFPGSPYHFSPYAYAYHTAKKE
jgi:hypothetical protein